MWITHNFLREIVISFRNETDSNQKELFLLSFYTKSIFINISKEPGGIFGPIFFFFNKEVNHFTTFNPLYFAKNSSNIEDLCDF